MALLNDRDRRKIQAELAQLQGPVKLVTFTQELACQFCRENDQLMRELSELSDKISVDVHNFQLDKEKVALYGVDKIPATVVEGARDYGIRFYGVPMGYEFMSLIGAIKDAARGATSLKPETKALLGGIATPVHLQVLVTPT
jgi:alkyl hydroperoxide reductase subunit AhpF